MNRAAAVIRFSYPAETPPQEWRWRFARFRDATLPSLRAQTVPLDVWVWVDRRHQDDLDAIGVSTFHVDEPAVVRTKPYLFSKFPWAAVHGLPRYEVQLSMGSDDVIAPELLERALAALEGKPQPAIASPQPWKFEIPRQRLYRQGLRYSERKPSPFLVIQQDPAGEPFIWPGVTGHMSIAPLVSSVTILPEGLAALCIHAWNDSTDISIGEDPLEGKVPAWVR